MKSKINSVDDYIAAQPESARAILERVRDAIRKAIPAAEETISYKIPAYRLKSEILNGETILYFAGWKNHYSLYPITASVIAEFKDEFASYEVNNKGTLRLPLSEPVPVQLIARIAKFRAKEIGGQKKKSEKRKIKKKNPISKLK
ncbi:MAG TPA: DUF1801 domain-containing protein [Candidatus Sulfotelmatobacter sp.]|jgi:uncharacterized protein YdhG (YjbR/CyaY superfamily)